MFYRMVQNTYPVFSQALTKFLVSKGLRWNEAKVHPVTGNIFHTFPRSPEFETALREWQANKPK